MIVTIQSRAKRLLFRLKESDLDVQKSHCEAIFNGFLYCNYEGTE